MSSKSSTTHKINSLPEKKSNFLEAMALHPQGRLINWQGIARSPSQIQKLEDESVRLVKNKIDKTTNRESARLVI